MKYIKSFESHRNSKIEPLNEELFGAIGKFFGNLFKKSKERLNKTKGGKEVDAIYQKYLKLINDEFVKLGQVDFNLTVATGTEPQTAPPAAADAAKAKVATENLKKIKAKLEQIIKKYKDMASKEMDAVLVKMGGNAKNPQLGLIIQAKKDEFDIAFMKAELDYLNKFGEKTMSAEISKQIDDKMKKSEDTFKNFDTLKPIEYKEGNEVIYLLKDKKKEDWDKLSEDEKKKPTEGKAKELVGVHKIVKIEGDKYTLEDADGKPTIVKTGAEILGKVEGTGGALELKPGISVVYKREKFDDKEWAKITEDDKKKPNEGKMKELQDKEMIGIKKIKEVKGDEVSFEDADFTKKKDEILSTVEGAPEESEDLEKTVSDLKTKNPESAKKVSSIAKLYQDAEKPENKEKIEQIDKLLSGEGK